MPARPALRQPDKLQRQRNDREACRSISQVVNVLDIADLPPQNLVMDDAVLPRKRRPVNDVLFREALHDGFTPRSTSQSAASGFSHGRHARTCPAPAFVAPAGA
jgi:hypothetical protein